MPCHLQILNDTYLSLFYKVQFTLDFPLQTQQSHGFASDKWSICGPVWFIFGGAAVQKGVFVGPPRAGRLRKLPPAPHEPLEEPVGPGDAGLCGEEGFSFIQTHIHSYIWVP